MVVGKNTPAGNPKNMVGHRPKVAMAILDPTRGVVAVVADPVKARVRGFSRPDG
jgi:hypothetical protein